MINLNGNHTIAALKREGIEKNGLAAVDCLSLPSKFSGAAYYIYNLTRALLKGRRSFRIVVLCRPEHQYLFQPMLKKGDELLPLRLRNRFERLWFYEFKLQKLLEKRSAELFYAMHYITPPRSKKYHIINTVHDLGFLLYPHYYSRVKRIYFGLRMPVFLKRSDRIVAISKTTAADLQRCFPELSSRISINIPGTDHILQTKLPKADKQGDVPFFLAVNTFEKRKNIPFLIDVFNLLKEQYRLPHKLILVGQKANGTRDVEKKRNASPFKSDILLPDWVEEQTLAVYYQECDAFINASLYEGFGFTPMEAIRCNRPVFLYRNNTVAELLGEATCLLDHLDAEKWAETIYEAGKNNYQNRLSPEAVRQKSWQQSAAIASGEIEGLLQRDRIRVSQ